MKEKLLHQQAPTAFSRKAHISQIERNGSQWATPWESLEKVVSVIEFLPESYKT